MKSSELIGCYVEYQVANGNLYQGKVIDKVRITNTREMEYFDLFLVCQPDGRVYKVSPLAIKRILNDMS